MSALKYPMHTKFPKIMVIEVMTCLIHKIIKIIWYVVCTLC